MYLWRVLSPLFFMARQNLNVITDSPYLSCKIRITLLVKKDSIRQVIDKTIIGETKKIVKRAKVRENRVEICTAGYRWGFINSELFFI